MWWSAEVLPGRPRTGVGWEGLSKGPRGPPDFVTLQTLPSRQCPAPALAQLGHVNELLWALDISCPVRCSRFCLYASALAVG